MGGSTSVPKCQGERDKGFLSGWEEALFIYGSCAKMADPCQGGREPCQHVGGGGAGIPYFQMNV